MSKLICHVMCTDMENILGDGSLKDTV